MSNYFDRFDPKPEADSGNPFDKFDAPLARRPQAAAGMSSAYRMAAKPKPQERTWGQAIGDAGAGVMSGLAGLVKTAGQLQGLTIGQPDNFVTRLGDEAQTQWRDMQSDALKAKRQARSEKIDQADGFFEQAGAAIKETVTDPALLTDLVAENITSLIPVGGAAQLGAKAGAKVAVQGAARLGKEATQEAVARAAGRWGTGAAIGTGAAMQGANVGGETYADLMQAGDEVWQGNAEYARRVAAGEDAAKVKHEMALSAARMAGAGAAGLSVATQALPGAATIERALAGRVSGASGIAGRALNAAKGLGGEGLQEALEEGGGQLIGNVAKRPVANTPLMEGVGESAGLGFVAGGAMGGAIGALQNTGGQQRIASRPVPQAAPEEVNGMKLLAAPNGETPYGVNIVTPSGEVITPEMRGEDPRVTGEPASPVPNPAAVPGVRAHENSLRPQASVPNPGAVPGSLSDAANAVAAVRTAARPVPQNDVARAPASEAAKSLGLHEIAEAVRMQHPDALNSAGIEAQSQAAGAVPETGKQGDAQPVTNKESMFGRMLREQAEAKRRAEAEQAGAEAPAKDLDQQGQNFSREGELARAALPSVLPWVNAETGEIRNPSDTELRNVMHGFMNRLQESGLGMRKTFLFNKLREMDGGLNGARLNAAYKEVQAERKRGLMQAEDFQAQIGGSISAQSDISGQPVAQSREPASGSGSVMGEFLSKQPESNLETPEMTGSLLSGEANPQAPQGVQGEALVKHSEVGQSDDLPVTMQNSDHSRDPNAAVPMAGETGVDGAPKLRQEMLTGKGAENATPTGNEVAQDDQAEDFAEVLVGNIRSLIPAQQRFERSFGKSQWAGRIKHLIDANDVLKGFAKETKAAGNTAWVKPALAKAKTSGDLIAIAEKLEKVVIKQRNESADASGAAAAPEELDGGQGQQVSDGLFGAPSVRDHVDAARRAKDAAPDGRTDMMAGDGELFADPRPAEVDIEDAVKAQSEPKRSNRDEQRPGNENGVPRGLPAEQTADSDRLEQGINRWRDREGHPGHLRIREVRAEALPDALRHALDRFHDATGTRIVLFRNLTPEVDDFNGVTFGDGTAYVNEDNQYPLTLTAAHEWLHNLRRTNSDLYWQLADEVIRQGDLPGYQQRLKREKEPRWHDMDIVAEELTAAAVSDALTDPAFLQRLAERNRGLFRRVARAFLDFLNTLTQGWRDQGSNAYLRDVEAFRDKLAAVLDALPARGSNGGADVQALFQRVWHGTPHRGIEKTGFKLNAIGTGEGAQAYGWGIYFASQKEVAEGYRASTSRPEVEIEGRRYKADAQGAYRDADGRLLDSKESSVLSLAARALYGSKANKPLAELAEEAESFLQTRHGIGAKRIETVKRAILNGEIKLINEGQLYQAEIPEDSDLLDFDAPLSAQPPKVRKALRRVAESLPESALDDLGGDVGLLLNDDASGKEIYDTLASLSGISSPRAASELLGQNGIPGLRYLDGNSRAAGEGSHNYVIWDEALLTPGAAQITPMFSRKKQLGELARQARAAGNENTTVDLGPVNTSQLELLRSEGLALDEGYKHTADMFAVRHALNRHSDAKIEKARGQLPLTDDDVQAIAEVVAAPDALALGAKTPRGQDVVGNIKRQSDGTILYIEEVRSGRRTLAMTSMRKYPGTSDFEAIANSLLPTNARSDAGDVRIVYLQGEGGQGDKPAFSRKSNGPTPEARAEAERQFKATERAYGGRAAYDKTKAAGKTKLTYGQWVQVRTPAFRAWFGNWEAVRAKDALQKMEGITSQFPAAFDTDFAKAKEAARMAFGKLREETEANGFGVTASDGRQIKFSGRGFKELSQHAADRRVLAVGANLKPLFESAVPLYSVQPSDKRQQVSAFHYYGVKADFGDAGQAFVLLEVIERANGEFFYDADATSLEEIKAASHAPLADQTKSGAGGGNAARSGRFAQWWNSVNPAEVSKVVDPETGEPLVVYHGTAQNFDAFDNKKTGANDRGLWGRGHYFASSANTASSYALRQGDGAQVVPAFVALKNPLTLKTGDDRITRLPDGRNYRELLGSNLDGSKIKEIALAGNHDGVAQILPSGMIGDVVAYSPNQIKSATGNNGVFDAGNDDIRFSRKAGDAQQQFKDTERVYGGRAAYDKAKAEGKTKLTYGQWVQVRTPNFKQWFGDWEAVQHREFLDGEPVKVLSGSEFAPDGIPLTEKVPKWYAEQGVSTVDVEGIGEVVLDVAAVKNSMSHGIGRDKATAFAAVPDVLRNGRIVYREAMRGSRDMGMVYHVAAPIEMAGKAFVMDVLVKSDANASRMYVHEVVLKEKLHDSAFKTGADAAEAGVRAGAESGAIRSVLQGIYAVNPAEVSKVTDPETGEPLVVYHGTSKRDAILDGGFKKGWTHLTDSRSVADSYQAWIKNGDVTPGTLDLYVKANNPAYYEAQGRKYTEIGHKVFRATSDAKRNGHDAIIITNIRDNFDSSAPTPPHTTVVAFNPNQIKSATGNNGAFDAGNDDIRFSRKTQTKAAYEARIDALFAGDRPSYKGVRILDRADMLDLLGHGDKPLHLVESAVGKKDSAGRVKHPGMTAEMWKRLPEWIENPVAAFESDTVDGRITLVAPDLVDGKPVLVVLEPNGSMAGMDVHVAVNAYEKDNAAGVPTARWVRNGKLLYLDQKRSPTFSERSKLQLPGEVRQLRGYKHRVQTEADLHKYRAERNEAMFSRKAQTREAYEARIDALFAGAKGNRQGVRILDRADILDLLGYGDKPLHLKESVVGKLDRDGQVKHPGMTAEMWKRLPDWIENPVAVYRSQTVPGALVMFAPELVAGRPVRITLEPNEGMAGLDVHVLSNAYEEGGTHITPVDKWTAKGDLLYLDQKRSPTFSERSGLRLPRDARQLRGYKHRVQTEVELRNYRDATDILQDDNIRESYERFLQQQEANAARQRLDTASGERSRLEGERLADELGLREAVEKVTASANVRVYYAADFDGLSGLVTEEYLERYQRNKLEGRSRGQAAGLYVQGYNTVDGQPLVVLYPNVVNTPTLAAFTAAHEVAGHHGLRKLLGKDLDKALEIANQNPTVKAVARSMMRQRNLTPKQRLLAIEEALADLQGAIRTGNFDRIEQKHGVKVPEGMKRDTLRTAIVNFLKRLKEIFTRKGVEFSDTQVRQLLEDAWKAAQGDGVQTRAAVESTEGSILESIKPEADAYRDTLVRLMADRRTLVQPIKVMVTPNVLLALGAPKMDVTIERDVIRKATNGVKHDVPMRVIERLPELMSDPAAVFDSKAEAGGFAVLLNAKDDTGRAVMVAVHLSAKHGRTRVNRIASVYGRPGNQYSGWVKDGLLRYVSDAKNPDLVRLMGLQLPASGSPNQGFRSRGSGKNILTREDVRNYRAARAQADSDFLESVEPDFGSMKPSSKRINEVLASATMERDAYTLDDARAQAKAFIGKPLINESTGLEARVSNTNLGKMTSEKAGKKSSTAADHALAVANVDKLFRNALLDHSHADSKGEPTIAAIHRYVAPMVTHDGRVVAVKMTVKETTGPKEPNPVYSIETLEIQNPPSVLSRVNPDGTGIHPQAGFSFNVLQHLEAVKQVVGRDEAMFSRKPSNKRIHSKPNEALADIEASVRAVMEMAEGKRSGPLLERAREKLADLTPSKVKDALRSSWLGALTLRHLTELGRDYFPTIGIYDDYRSRMSAHRNRLQQEANDVAEKVRDWAGKNVKAARALFDLMHDATIDGNDPAEEYKPLQFRYGGQLHEVNQKNVKDARKAIRQQMRDRSGDSKQDMQDEYKALGHMLKAEARRKKNYPALRQRWEALTKDAQQHYLTMRDMYKARSEETEAALIARINDLEVENAGRKRVLINKIRQQFESQRLQGVYFPLQRYGQYFVAAEKGGGHTFLMFDSLNKAERAAKGLREQGFTITASGKKGEGKASDAPSGTFVAEVIEALRESKVSEATQDKIYQMYLEALPELSMRKHSIHRKSVPGFDPDAVRAFAHNMHHGAHQIARLHYAHKMSDTLRVLREQQEHKRRDPNADVRQVAAGDALLGELEKRDAWINNPQDSSLTNMVSSFGFVYYLGASPAAALVNLTQTPLVTYPYLAARYGATKAGRALAYAMKETTRTLGNAQTKLTDPDEIKALKRLQEIGALDKTEAHSLAGIAEGGLLGDNPKWRKAMKWIGIGFHKTEIMNREATGLATFRLARSAGASFDEAVQAASDAIFQTHYDYSNENRARFMQPGWAKVLLMFRQYSLNTTWHLARMVWQATKDADAETRKLARRNLAGILVMSSIFSGAMGLPMLKTVMGVLSSVAAVFGDDDEPWDAETEFAAFLSDMLGRDAARVVLHGAANAVTGADIASRVGLGELWIRDADRELDGRGEYFHLLEQVAGPLGGVLKNYFAGKSMIEDGKYWRGIETMLPKGLKDAFKSARYATEGVNTLRGDPIVQDVSIRQLLLQFNGFTPAQVSEQYDTNNKLKNYEQYIRNRRQDLMNAIAMSIQKKDMSGRAKIVEKIKAFNRKYPEIAIDERAIRQSLMARARHSQNAEGGILLNQKLAPRIRDAVGV